LISQAPVPASNFAPVPTDFPGYEQEYLMRTYKFALAVGGAFCLGMICLVNVQAADDDPPPPGMREALDKLAEGIAKDPAAAKKDVKANFEKFELDDVMRSYKLREKDGKVGWGIGARPTGLKDDGMEARIINLSKKSPNKDELAKQEKDLMQMANRSAAIAEVAITKSPKPGLKDWKEWSEKMSKSSQELAKAVKDGDPKAVKSAAGDLAGTCTDCHAKYRQ
jgi:soluble cytochrome b562